MHPFYSRPTCVSIYLWLFPFAPGFGVGNKFRLPCGSVTEDLVIIYIHPGQISVLTMWSTINSGSWWWVHDWLGAGAQYVCGPVIIAVGATAFEGWNLKRNLSFWLSLLPIRVGHRLANFVRIGLKTHVKTVNTEFWIGTCLLDLSLRNLCHCLCIVFSLVPYNSVLCKRWSTSIEHNSP